MILEVTVGGRSQRVETVASDGRVLVHVGGSPVSVRLEPVAGSQWWRLTTDRAAVLVRLRQDNGGLLATVGSAQVAVGIRRALPIPSRRQTVSNHSGRLEVRSPMPGLVVAVPSTGAREVQAGGVVAIVEAMKMQMEVPSPAAGRIEEIRVQPGQEVTGGQVLVVLRVSTPDE